MIPWRALARLFPALALACALFAPPALAADDAPRPVPAFTGYVVDEAGLFAEDRRAQLEGFLDQLHEKTGAQLAVLTVTNSGPETPQGFKTRVFKEWVLGDKERDDGVLLLVSMDERRLEFETGYGLEGTLPDGWQARMLRDVAVPRFRAGEPGEGVIAAVLATAQRIAAEKGVTLTWDGRELRYRGTRRASAEELRFLVPLLVFMLVFVILPAVLGARRMRRRGWWTDWGGPGSWGGGWGGGFGGGGGGGFGGGGGGGFGGGGGGSSGGGGGGAGW